MPLGDVGAEKSVSILVLCCIDNVLDSRLTGYDVVAGMSGSFRSWLLELVNQECSPVVRGIDDPRDIAMALSSEAGIAALDRGLRAAETWLAQCGDPLSAVGSAARLVGWGNVQQPGAVWKVCFHVKGDLHTFRLSVAEKAASEPPFDEDSESGLTIVARDLGGMLPLE